MATIAEQIGLSFRALARSLALSGACKAACGSVRVRAGVGAGVINIPLTAN